MTYIFLNASKPVDGQATYVTAQLLYQIQHISNAQQTFKNMDIYQIASEYWGGSDVENDPSDPRETPPFDPRPEVPSPDVPEETPPFEREPETPPISPEPELPPVEPVIPEIDPLPQPGGEPDIPAFY